MSETTSDGAIAAGEAVTLNELLSYAGQGAVVSRTLAKNPGGSLTLFAFDQGQELSEHSAPFDAHVLVVDGEVELTIGGETVRAAAGQLVRMPADVPHAVRATTPMKMLLVMLRDPR